METTTMQPQTITPAVNIFDVMTGLINQKATICKYGEMGFIHSILCTIEKVYLKDYAQYKDSLHIQYRPKNKRSSYVWRIHGYERYAIYAGHVELNTSMFVKVQTDERGTTISEPLASFSPEYLEIAIKSTTHSPLIVKRKD